MAALNIYEARTINEINKKNIKIGKTFKYSDNYHLTNIYYINPGNDLPSQNESTRQDTTNEKSKLIIQTPLLYVPNSFVYFNEKPFLDLSFNNEENDPEVAEFKAWITNIEDTIYKLIKKRTSLKIERQNMTSLLKAGYRNTASKLQVPINLNISKCILSEDGKKTKFLFNWEIPVPTYAISIIWIKNIWVKTNDKGVNKWGVNLFMYASRVMNSHILDPIDFMGQDINNKNIKVNEIVKIFKQDEKMSIKVGNIPEYVMFFKMLKIGIPKDAVAQKITLSGLDKRFIDFPEDTPYVTVLHYISNPNLPPYVKPSIITANSSGSHGIPPPPPPPFMLGNGNVAPQLPNFTPMGGIFGGIGANNNPSRAGLLNQISGGNFKLKKIDPEEEKERQKSQMIEKLKKENNNPLIPQLADIQSALSRLKKIDLDKNNNSNC